ncbi:MAG TPA: hypothetical protein VIP98_23430 [Microlunatus sp.]
MTAGGLVPPGVLEFVRREFGPEVEITGIAKPGSWAVARICLAGGGAPPTVIAKWLRTGSDGWRTDPRQLHTEAVALRFTAELAPDLVPELLAADVDSSSGAVLLEDLAPREPLDALIRREGSEQTDGARLAFARAMGRLAATTAGPDHDHELQRRLGSRAAVDPAVRRLGILGPPWERMRTIIEEFGVGVPAAAECEAIALRALFAEPGPFLALSNGDMATNNFMINITEPANGRMIDFESAHYDHALSHPANFFVPGPPWMAINDPIADRLEDQFRTALTAGIPQAADDQRYHLGIAAGCVAMGFQRCGNLPVMDIRPPGDPSRTQRVLTLESAARAAEARGRWTALTDLLRALATALRRRWPDVDVDLGSVRPYTPRLGWADC